MAKAKTERPKPSSIPKIGDGVTYHIGSDSYPGTVSWVSENGLQFKYQDDQMSRTGEAVFNTDRWHFTPNKTAEEKEVRWTTLGGVGRYCRTDMKSGYVEIGVRHYYQDRDR